MNEPIKYQKFDFLQLGVSQLGAAQENVPCASLNILLSEYRLSELRELKGVYPLSKSRLDAITYIMSTMTSFVLPQTRWENRK